MKRVLALLLSAAPFVAGAVAALSARRDVRMLWMALVATLIAWSVMMPMRGRRGAVPASFVAATVASSIVAVLLGAHAAFGVIAVAVVLSAFAVAGAALGIRTATS